MGMPGGEKQNPLSEARHNHPVL